MKNSRVAGPLCESDWARPCARNVCRGLKASFLRNAQLFF